MLKKKLFLVAFMVLTTSVTVACDRPMMVYNGCGGSWVRVHDGRGNLLIDRLNYGLESAVDVDGYEGSTIELLAAGFDLKTNKPLGSAVTSRSIPYSGFGTMVGPSQIPPWQITSLYTTDSDGGCRR